MPNLVKIDYTRPGYEAEPNTTIHENEGCLIEKTKSWFGVRCVHDVCEWRFSSERNGATVIAHDTVGYDYKFVYQLTVQNKHDVYRDPQICPAIITLYTYVITYNMRCIDRNNFDATPLGRLPKAYGIDTSNRDLPHVFHRPEN